MDILMILVTLGTQDKQFMRLIETIENLVITKIIKEDVVVQAGNTEYKSEYLKIIDFTPYDEFENLIKNCSLLITHGGVGSIIAGLKLNKVVIAVPRLKKYNEHENDHQLQIVKSFAQKKYILAVENLDTLPNALKKSKKFKPEKYESNTQNMINTVRTAINEISNKKL